MKLPDFLDVVSFVLGGVSVSSGVYLSGLIILLGDTSQVKYVVIGIILGCVVFSAIAVFLRLGLLYSSLFSITLLALLRYYVDTIPLLDDISLSLIFALSCSLLLPLDAVLRRIQDSGRVSRFLSIVTGSILIFLAAAGIYAERGYTGLSSIVLGIDAIGLAVVATFLARSSLHSRRAIISSVKSEAKKRGLRFVLLFFLVMLAVGGFSSHIADANTSNATPIRHVVIIMMENHSFDNLFGVYPESNRSSQYGIQRPVNLLNSSVLSDLKAIATSKFVVQNPVEGYIAYHKDWSGGSMLGFAANSGEQSMTYFTSSQLGFEWDLAEQYSIADMYFASQLSETAPNRLYSLAGYSPVINDYGPPPYIPLQQSIFYELNSYKVSWNYYVMDPARGVGTLSYFYGIQAYDSHILSWHDFEMQAMNNSLPDVAWLMPVDGGAEGYSQGPPSDVLKGELWMLYAVNLIESSPGWNSTAIFVTYDEGGGFYDHVPPPILAGTQLGERVPLIVISPYAKEGYVSHTLMSHTSLLAFIDYNWRLPALNGLVARSNLPLDMFNFNLTYEDGNVARKSIIFSNLGFPVPPSFTFGSDFMDGIKSLSYLFPMKPQIPYDQLPYAREGESSLAYSSFSAAIYVDKNSSFIPFYESEAAIALIYLVMLTPLYLLKGRDGNLFKR